MKVTLPQTIGEFFKQDRTEKLIAHPDGDTPLNAFAKKVASGGNYVVAIGPEGGFTDDEVNIAIECGAAPTVTRQANSANRNGGHRGGVVFHFPGANVNALQRFCTRWSLLCCVFVFADTTNVVAQVDVATSVDDAVTKDEAALLAAAQQRISKRELSECVRRAYLATHDGWSTDEVLLQDSLNKAFLKQCHNELPNVAPGRTELVAAEPTKGGQASRDQSDQTTA